MGTMAAFTLSVTILLLNVLIAAMAKVCAHA
jgi:hypothetical protein